VEFEEEEKEVNARALSHRAHPFYVRPWPEDFIYGTELYSSPSSAERRHPFRIGILRARVGCQPGGDEVDARARPVICALPLQHPPLSVATLGRSLLRRPSSSWIYFFRAHRGEVGGEKEMATRASRFLGRPLRLASHCSCESCLSLKSGR
jgi:hypothetical protein